MSNNSLTFRVLKAILALPVPVCIIIPSILLYFSHWQPGGFVLWRFIIGAICFLAGILLAISTVRLFPKLGNGTPAPWDPTTKMIVTGPYAYVRNPMITGVVLILASEALMLGSLAIGIWAVVFLIINMFTSHCPKSQACVSVSAKNMRNTANTCLVTSHDSRPGNPSQHHPQSNLRPLKQRESRNKAYTHPTPRRQSAEIVL